MCLVEDRRDGCIGIEGVDRGIGVDGDRNHGHFGEPPRQNFALVRVMYQEKYRRTCSHRAISRLALTNAMTGASTFDVWYVATA